MVVVNTKLKYVLIVINTNLIFGNILAELLLAHFAKKGDTTNLERIVIEEAKESVEKAVHKGFVISVYGFPVPFVGGICMCEYPACMALKSRLDYGLDYIIKKAESVVRHDIDKCTGCGKCIGKCQFGAIYKSRTLGKALFNIEECFGCGVCLHACEQNAIELVPREQDPAVRGAW